MQQGLPRFGLCPLYAPIEVHADFAGGAPIVSDGGGMNPAPTPSRSLPERAFRLASFASKHFWHSVRWVRPYGQILPIAGFGFIERERRFLLPFALVLFLPFFLAAQSQKEAAREVLIMLSVIQQEYALAFHKGEVVKPEEIEESLTFLEEALKKAEVLKTAHLLQPIEEKMRRRASPALVGKMLREARESIATSFQVEGTVSFPPKPDLAIGRKLYQQHCASCHGNRGDGEGSAGKGLLPPPRNFRAPDFAARASKQNIFNVISVGVPGTAMPAFRQLSEEEKILIASFVFDLSGAGKIDVARRWAEIKREWRNILSLKSSKKQAEALKQLYLKFEFIEPSLGKNGKLLEEAETIFTQSFDSRYLALHPELLRKMQALIPQIEESLFEEANGSAVFVQSFVILFREGMEIILLLALLLSLIKKAKLSLFVPVYAGSLSAVLLSILLAFWLTSLQENVVRRELMEGGAHLLAALVLFFVSFYFLSQREAKHWTALIKAMASRATQSFRPKILLFGIAFLTVFREGIETVLFYQALYLSAPAAFAFIGAGFFVACLFLLFFAYLLFRTTVRLPLDKLFFYSGAFLQILCLIFLGKGIHALQEAQIISSHYSFSAWHFPLIGIYPTWEGFLPQASLFLIFLVTFLTLSLQKLRENRT